MTVEPSQRTGSDPPLPPLGGQFGVRPLATGWRLAARTWVHAGGEGGLPALVERVARAFQAIPASLELSAPK